MKIVYTIAEIKSCNKLTRQIAKKAGMPVPTSDDELITLLMSQPFWCFADNGTIVMEIPEEKFVAVTEIIGENIDTFYNIFMALKSINELCKSSLKSMNKKLGDVFK